MRTLPIALLALFLIAPLSGAQTPEVLLPKARSSALEKISLGRNRIVVLPRRPEAKLSYRVNGSPPVSLAQVREFLLGRRKASGDDGRLAKLGVLVHADRRAEMGELLKLLETCAHPDVAVWKIKLATAPIKGDRVGFERLMPLFLPTDIGVGKELSRKAAPTLRFDDETFEAAIDALPFGTALEYRYEKRHVAVRDFARMARELKGSDATAVVKLGIPKSILVGDFVAIVDLLRGCGFRSDAQTVDLRLEGSRPAARTQRIHLERIRSMEEIEEVEEVEPAAAADDRAVRLRAIDAGLAWLARHQSPDGSWDTDEFMLNGDPKFTYLCDGGGQATHDVASTGLALLAFLGAGNTHKAGPYKKNVTMGLKWLRDQQDAEGCFGGRNLPQFTYNHAIATLAMTEAYGLTQSPLFKSAAQQGIQFAIKCQNPYKAWRYGVKDGQNDTSVTGWMIMALKSGQLAGFEVPKQHFEWALSWIDEMTDDEKGRTGYIRRGEPSVRDVTKKESHPAMESEALTAIAIMTRIFCGEDPSKSDAIKKGAELIAAKPMRWDEKRGSIDMYYWYFGTLAMYQVGGEHWKTWAGAMSSTIAANQRQDGNFKGSWDPKGAWGDAGGRIYATALMTLSMEVYYRYGRVSGIRSGK